MEARLNQGNYDATPRLPMNESPSRSYKWDRGIRRTPILAPLCLTLIAACITSSIIIVYDSHNKATATWGWGHTVFRPSVLFSVMVGITSTAFPVVLSCSVKTAWWCTALQGTTLSDLHHVWSSGDSVMSAFGAGRKFSIISLGKIMVVVSGAAGGFLLQKSSHISTLPLITGTKSFAVAPSFQSRSLGVVSGDLPANFTPSATFANALQYYNDNLSFKTRPEDACNDTICQGNLTVPGVAIINFSNEIDDQNTTLNLAVPGTHTIFHAYVERRDQNQSTSVLLVNVSYVESVDSNCLAVVRTQIRWYRSAIISRPISIQNDSVSYSNLWSPKLLTWADAPGDLSFAQDGAIAGPLRALEWYAHSYASGLFQYTYPQGNWTYDTPTALQYVSRHNPIGKCGPVFYSPMDFFSEQFNTLLLQSAVKLANQNDTTKIAVLITEPVFVSEPKFLWAAVVIYVLTMIFVLIPLRGSWKLGRDISLSPVETAAALGAPIFRFAADNATADQLLKELGNRNVKYGYAFEKPEFHPMYPEEGPAGGAYGGAAAAVAKRGDEESEEGRLVIADSDRYDVVPPTGGAGSGGGSTGRRDIRMSKVFRTWPPPYQPAARGDQW